MKTTQFAVKRGEGSSLDCIEASDLSPEQFKAIRTLMSDNYSLGETYKIRQPSHAFLQGQQEPRPKQHDGWVLIEFWTGDKDAIAKFISFVNKALSLDQVPARLDTDRTAKPKTRLVGHAPRTGDCIGPLSIRADSLESLENGDRTPIEDYSDAEVYLRTHGGRKPDAA